MSDEVSVDPAWGKFRPPFKPSHVSAHNIHNGTTEPIAFKIRSSDNYNIRISPVYGIISPNSKALLSITCLRRKPPHEDREDKVKVCLKVIDVVEAEASKTSGKKRIKDFFKDEKMDGFVEIFIITKSREYTTAKIDMRSRHDSRSEFTHPSRSSKYESRRTGSSRSKGRSRRRNHNTNTHISQKRVRSEPFRRRY